MLWLPYARHRGVGKRSDGSNPVLPASIASVQVSHGTRVADAPPARRVATRGGLRHRATSIGHNGPVTGRSGSRGGARRGTRARRALPRVVWGYAVGVTLAVVAWGFLVWSAIDFGASARAGDPSAWWLLAVATVGAIACLFLALMLLARISRALGITIPPEGVSDGTSEGAQEGAPDGAPDRNKPPRPGGHRAKR